MKPVRRLTAEPAALARYRAQYPEEVAAPADHAARVWRRFRDDPAYVVVRDALNEAQQGLCIYCEKRLVDDAGVLIALDYQVEHVEPKSGATGRTLDWTNLALACCGGNYEQQQDESLSKSEKGARSSCGQHKGERRLRPKCDPRDFPSEARLVDLSLDSTLAVDIGACKRHQVPPANLDATINKVLNLNCERLRVARQDAADNVRGWFVPLLGQLLDDTHLDGEQQRQMLDLLIAGRLQPDAGGNLRRFWTTERCVLGLEADQWVEAHLSLFA